MLLRLCWLRGWRAERFRPPALPAAAWAQRETSAVPSVLSRRFLCDAIGDDDRMSSGLCTARRLAHRSGPGTTSWRSSHPDAQPEGPLLPDQHLQRSFLEVHAAFEELMEDLAPGRAAAAHGGRRGAALAPADQGRARRAGRRAASASRGPRLSAGSCAGSGTSRARSAVWLDIKERHLCARPSACSPARPAAACRRERGCLRSQTRAGQHARGLLPGLRSHGRRLPSALTILRRPRLSGCSLRKCARRR